MPKADIIPIGAAVSLISTKSLAKELNLTMLQTHWFLRNLSIPRIKFKARDYYFNLYALELVLFTVLGPGGYGISVPGSDNRPDHGFKRRVHPDLAASLVDPQNPVHARCALAGLSHAHGNRRYLEARLRSLANTLLRLSTENTLKLEKKSGKRTRGRKILRQKAPKGTSPERPVPPGSIRLDPVEVQRWNMQVPKQGARPRDRLQRD